MHNKFTAGLYFVLCLFPWFSGCFCPGCGGGTFYSPPQKIICDEPWVIIVKFVVIPVDPKEKHGKLAERCKDFVVYIRDSLNGNFLAVPMVIESVNPDVGEAHLKADMEPIPCDSGIEYVEYYMDHISRHTYYNRSKLYKIPVGKD